MTEAELRDDAHKWETTLCAYSRLKGKSISDPVFELHHNPRAGGGATTEAMIVPYAMIVSVHAPKMKNLYRQVFFSGCDIVFGCVDGFAERRELEICCRRYMIPLVDVGMDVHMADDEATRMGGQVILSMPGSPCMTCLGFLNEANLAHEAQRYGDAGARPQVVWPNGVLASTAVGIAVDLLTDWTLKLRGPVYLSYNGNDGTVTCHPRLTYFQGGDCPHFPQDQVGDPLFKTL
jgi:hypothetical protein